MNIKINSSGNLYTSFDGKSSNTIYYINGRNLVQITTDNINGISDTEKNYISYKYQNDNRDLQMQIISFDFNEEGR